MPPARAAAQAQQISQFQQSGSSTGSIPHFIRLDFAHAIQSVLYGMCGIMAAAALIAFIGLSRGVQQETDETEATLAAEAAT